MERRLFPLVLATKKPMLGICRVCSCSMSCWADALSGHSTECPSGVEHHETPPYDKAAHTVCLAQDTPLFLAVGEEQIHVNSYHHQGIKALGKGLCEAAAAPDGLDRKQCTCRSILSAWQCSGILSFPIKRMKTAGRFFGRL